MTQLLSSIQKAHSNLGRFMDIFMDYHPILGYTLAFIIVPALMLLALFAGVCIFTLPFSLLLL